MMMKYEDEGSMRGGRLFGGESARLTDLINPGEIYVLDSLIVPESITIDDDG